MKKSIVAVIALLGLLVSQSGVGAEGNPASPVAQEIAVALVPDEHLLKGDTTIDYAAGPGTLMLELDPAALIDKVSSAGQTLPYTFHGGRLNVSRSTAPAGPISINISYRLIRNDRLPSATDGGENPGYGIDGIISPQGVFLGSSLAWYPRPAVPPLRRTILIAAPAGMEALTAGERMSRETSGVTTRSVWQEEPPSGEPALVAGPYRIKERQLPGILVSTYLYPENAHLADSYLESASNYLRLFAELFGPYPFTKFAVVENFFPTGYGFPSFTLLGSTVIRLPFIATTSLPHEIAHSWWGNCVMVDSSQGNWSEGLVTYLADQLLEERKGKTAGSDYRLRLLTDYSLLVPGKRDFPLSRFSSRVDPASRAIGYGKGAMLWHMLRRQVGDEAFFAALREVFRSRRFKSAAWSDFSEALGRSSGQKTDSFMTAWLELPGGPNLSLADVQSRRQGGTWLVTGRVVQTLPVFPLYLPLRLETAAGSFDQTLPVNGEQALFHFVTVQPPDKLLLDPDVDVFRLLPASQLPPNVNRLKGSSRLLGVTTPRCGAAEESLKLLLESLGQEGARITTEEELSGMGSRDHDLIYCGEPQDSAALFDFPPGVKLGRDSFTVNGERFDGVGDLLFLVTRQAASPGRVIALLLPLTPAATGGAITKISHYGNFATLVFSGGVNRFKGRVPQQAAGDQVIFNSEE